jgi:hypothetical protein
MLAAASQLLITATGRGWHARDIADALTAGCGVSFRHSVRFREVRRHVSFLQHWKCALWRKSNRPATARADQEMSDGAIQRGRPTYSATASAKIALPCCVCRYQSVKRKT